MDYTYEFFRMVFSQNLTHSFMEMPMVFSIHNGMRINRKVTLLNHDVKFWHIPIVRSARGVIYMFGAPFRKYVKEYNVAVGGGLKFRYIGGDSFKVSNFDSDGQHVPMNTPADGAVRPGYAGMLDNLEFLIEEDDLPIHL
ncbi:hypothetical protein ACFE04_022256 [Oxalis oulophora]